MYKKDEDVSKRIILQTLEQGKVDTYHRVCRHLVAQLGAGQPEAEGLQKRHRAVAAAAVLPPDRHPLPAGCDCHSFPQTSPAGGSTGDNRSKLVQQATRSKLLVA